MNAQVDTCQVILLLCIIGDPLSSRLHILGHQVPFCISFHAILPRFFFPAITHPWLVSDDVLAALVTVSQAAQWLSSATAVGAGGWDVLGLAHALLRAIAVRTAQLGAALPANEAAQNTLYVGMWWPTWVFAWACGSGSFCSIYFSLLSQVLSHQFFFFLPTCYFPLA